MDEAVIELRSNDGAVIAGIGRNTGALRRRAFFGTNWPLDRLFSSYTDLVAAYATLIEDFTPGEQLRLFSGNATRIFNLSGK